MVHNPFIQTIIANKIGHEGWKAYTRNTGGGNDHTSGGDNIRVERGRSDNDSTGGTWEWLWWEMYMMRTNFRSDNAVDFKPATSFLEEVFGWLPIRLKWLQLILNLSININFLWKETNVNILLFNLCGWHLQLNATVLCTGSHKKFKQILLLSHCIIMHTKQNITHTNTPLRHTVFSEKLENYIHSLWRLTFDCFSLK